MKHMTQAQLANRCRLLANVLSTDARSHERGEGTRGDLLHAAMQLQRLAQDSHTIKLDFLSVSVYCDSAVDLIIEAYGLRIDRHERKVAAHG